MLAALTGPVVIRRLLGHRNGAVLDPAHVESSLEWDLFGLKAGGLALVEILALCTAILLTTLAFSE